MDSWHPNLHCTGGFPRGITHGRIHCSQWIALCIPRNHHQRWKTTILGDTDKMGRLYYTKQLVYPDNLCSAISPLWCVPWINPSDQPKWSTPLFSGWTIHGLRYHEPRSTLINQARLMLEADVVVFLGGHVFAHEIPWLIAKFFNQNDCVSANMGCTSNDGW